MDNRLNFHFRFRPFRERFLRFKTTDGTRWILLVKREHSRQIGIIMRLKFYKDYNEEGCYYLTLNISSATKHVSGTLRTSAIAYYCMTEITIDFREVLSEFTYDIDLLSDPSVKIYNLVKEKLRIEVEIHRVINVLVPPLRREFGSKELFSDQIYSLVSSWSFTDVILMEGTDFTESHRCILSVGSKYFFSCFEGRQIKQNKVIGMAIHNLELLRDFIYYNYSGKIRPMDFLLTGKMVYLAESHGAEKFRNLCKKMLNTTVCGMLIFAHKNNISQLKTECRKYILQNLNTEDEFEFGPKWQEVLNNWKVLIDEDTTSV